MSKVKVGSEVKYPGGSTVPTVFLSGSRATVAATSVSSSATAIPSGARVVAVRASVCVWIRWGTSGVGDAAADSNSQLFPPGEIVIPVPYSSGTTPATHFKALREGTTDGYVQVEQVSHVDTVG